MTYFDADVIQLLCRSEIDRLTALLHSRTLDINIGDEQKKSEVIPSEPVVSIVRREEVSNVRREELSKAQALENGIGSHFISTPVVSSSVGKISSILFMVYII